MNQWSLDPLERDGDEAPEGSKRLKTEEASHPDDGQDTVVNDSSIKERLS